MGTKNLNSATDMITFTRASGGTALRKISYGSELVTNGTFDTTSGWVGVVTTTDQRWYLDNGTLTKGGMNGTIYQILNPYVAGKTYLLQFDVIALPTGNVVAAIGNATHVLTGTGTESVYLSPTDVTISLRFYTGGAGGNAVVLDNVSVKEVLYDQADGTLQLFNHPANTPRIEYSADGTVKGLLIEEARTNLLSYSEDFNDSSWEAIRLSVTASSTISPDGSNNGWRLTAAGTSYYFRTNIASSTTSTYSIYVKKDTSDYVALGAGGGAKGFVMNFSFTTETIVDTNQWGGATYESSAVENSGNGWYRIILIGNQNGAGRGIGVFPWDSATAPTSTENHGATSTNSVYIYGAQTEQGSFPTSYIPTTGSTATRSADIASIPVSDFGYNQDAGSVVVEARTIHTNNVNFARLGARSSYDNGVDFYVSSGALSAYLWYQNTTSASASFGPASANTTYKFAAAIEQNNTAFAFNGSSTNTDTNSPVRYADAIYIGDKDQNNLYGSCHIKSIKYYPRRLTNDQLAEITT